LSDALETTIRARGLGDEHAALVGLLRAMAEIPDGGSRSPGLYGEYRMALDMLQGIEVEDGEASVLSLMCSAVGDGEDGGPSDGRARARRGRRGARPTSVLL
jgi:hypothetical protein